MNDGLRQLSALDALGALSPDDAARLADALPGDADLTREHTRDRAVVEALEGVVARAEPPPELGDRLAALARADLEASKSLRPIPVRRPRARPRWLFPAFGGALAAAAVIVLTVVVTGGSGLGPPDQEVDIVAVDQTVRGKVALYDTDRPNGQVFVDLESLEPAPSGHHYEVWVLRKGVTTMEPVGTFTSTGSPVHLELRLPGAGDYAALDISVEEDGGPAEHSGKSVAGAKFASS